MGFDVRADRLRLQAELERVRVKNITEPPTRWAEFRRVLWWKCEHLRNYRRVPGRFKDDVASVLTRHLPGRLRYWAAISVGVYATTGDYSDTVVPEITMMEVLQRWEKDHR